LTTFTAGACDDATGPEFDSALGVDLEAMTQTTSGLYVLDVTIGAGAVAAAGSTATVRYSGWVESGARFDSGNYTFRLGQREAIDGFDEGVTGMRVGGKRRIVVPPSLGYGDRGQGSIPPNAYLLFDLELLSVTP
jgi:FKBP-type peptidyl-prolyl cis-trans isomerase